MKRRVAMRRDEILKLVNHEAWMEHSGTYPEVGTIRAYLKWGGLPEVDGRLDPQAVRRAFAVDPMGTEKPLLIGMDKEASSKGGLFIEFKAEKPGVHTIALEYDRKTYTVTQDERWCFGEKRHVASLGYNVKEARWLFGYVKTYALVGEGEVEVKPNPVGLELELLPEVIKRFKPGDKVRMQLLFRGKPLAQRELTIRTGKEKKTIMTDSDGWARVELGEGVTVVSARYMDEMSKIEGVCDGKSINTTISMKTER